MDAQLLVKNLINVACWDTKQAMLDWRISGLSHSESRNVAARVPRNLREASVLLLIRVGQNEPKIVLTQRSRVLRTHANMWSLPGGRVENCDIDLRATAIRETCEELGVASDAISVIGRIPDHILLESRYRLAVFIGLLDDCLDLKPNTDEVEQVIEFPVSSLLDQENWCSRKRDLGNVVFLVKDFTFEKAHVWGATAGILTTFSRLLGDKYGLQSS